MREIATENIVIGVLASIGVMVLIMVFVYVVKQMFTQKGD
jgi:cbb3-type cytochrome oxidase subunit 3